MTDQRLIAFGITMGLALALIAGCVSSQTPSSVARPNMDRGPDSKPLVVSQQKKDERVSEEARAIATEFPAAVPRTDAILQAIAEAPASAIVTYVLAIEKALADRDTYIVTLERGIRERDSTIQRLQAENAKLKNGIMRAVQIMINAAAIACVIGGTVMAFLGGKVAAFGPLVGVAVGSAGIILFAIGQAVDWVQRHPAVILIVGIPLAAGLFGMIINVIWTRNSESKKGAVKETAAES